MKQWLLSALIVMGLGFSISARADRLGAHAGDAGTSPVAPLPPAKGSKLPVAPVNAGISNEDKMVALIKHLYECINRPGSDTAKIAPLR